ncbi:MAG: DNA replication/repair protein RecF [Patescibacteria group bacterium]|jgi:DNA replication and repair protein RecF
MEIKQLTLKNFRNYSKKDLKFPSGTTLIVGNNAVGKTNILEAIYLLATGKSFRVKGVEGEMIHYGEEIASVKAETSRDRLEIILTRGEVMGEKAAKKRYLVNDVGKRAADFTGNLKTVYFGPEDLDIVIGSPSTRRKYLDSVLTQVDREYARAILSYEKGLRARNKILEFMKETGEADRRKLFFWDQLLIKNGNLITQRRESLINFVNSNHLIESSQFNLEYDRSTISEQRLTQYEKEEVAAGTTLVGPHRDDFLVKLEERDLAPYGSRGEQRLAVLWLKLSELSFIKNQSEDTPVLLLDDIFSELDEKHQHLVLEVVDKQQTIITSANLELAEEDWLSGVNVITF